MFKCVFVFGCLFVVFLANTRFSALHHPDMNLTTISIDFFFLLVFWGELVISIFLAFLGFVYEEDGGGV